MMTASDALMLPVVSTILESTSHVSQIECRWVGGINANDVGQSKNITS